jgi:hypothetical protein
METQNMFEDVSFDRTIESKTSRAYTPYDTNKLEQSDVIRIPVQNQDGYTLPCESWLYVRGTVSNVKGDAIRDEDIMNNAFAFLFDEMRYEVNGVEVCCIRNPGLTSLAKGLLTLTPGTVKGMQNAGWILPDATKTKLIKGTNFDVSFPLASLMGFFEDYQNLLVNCKQELILIRSRTDYNSLKIANMPTGSEAEKAQKMPIIKISQILWHMIHVRLSDEANAPLLKKISDGASILAIFRNHELHERPNVPKSSPITWTVKTSSYVDRPSYICVFFQTNRSANLLTNSSQFDHCNVRSVKLFINSEQWPYDKVEVDFSKGQTAHLYNMYAKFQASYYGKESEPLLSRDEFIDQNPMWVIDCSHQSQPLKMGGVDVKVEIIATQDFPDDTTVFCMIIHDKTIEMTPLTSQVLRIA